MSSSFIVYVASQYAMGETPSFATAVSEAKIANARTALVWPFPAPVYDKGDAADKLRKSRYGQACQDAKGVFRDAANLVAKGHKMRVWIGTGVILMSDLESDPKVYGNVVLPELLAELAKAADEYKVGDGSDDPREYVAD